VQIFTDSFTLTAGALWYKYHATVSNPTNRYITTIYDSAVCPFAWQNAFGFEDTNQNALGLSTVWMPVPKPPFFLKVGAQSL
jgi:hypothetical protein